MRKSIQNLIHILKKDLVFSLILMFSLIFFLFKGIRYSLIGSFVPLVLILMIIFLFVAGSFKSQKVIKRIITLWTILIIIWSIVRIALSLINHFVKPIPESHVAEQLGTLGLIQSFIFLFGAIYLWKNKNRIF